MARVAQPLQFAPIPTDIGRRQQIIQLADALHSEGDLLPAVAVHTLLWAFVCSSDPRKNGRFGPMSAGSLARMCCWPGDAKLLLTSLISTGIIVVQTSGDWRLDGWEEHAGKALKNRRTETAGKRAQRAKAKEDGVGSIEEQSLSPGQSAGHPPGHPAGPFRAEDQDQDQVKDPPSNGIDPAGSSSEDRAAPSPLAEGVERISPETHPQAAQTTAPIPAPPPPVKNAVTVPQNAPDGDPDDAPTVDLAADARRAPLDLVMDVRSVIAEGANAGLGVMPGSTITQELAAACPIRRTDFRSALTTTKQEASSPCWKYFLKVLLGRRAKQGRAVEPILTADDRPAFEKVEQL